MFRDRIPQGKVGAMANVDDGSVSSWREKLLSINDFEQAARARLSGSAYGYYAGGADGEVTMASNLTAWDRLELRPHVLRDVHAVDTTTTVLGMPISAPIMIGPTGHQRLAHGDGEAATAAGAAAAGTIFVVPTFSSVALETVAAAAAGAIRWFQLYIHRDRGLTAELVRRAETAGYRAIVVTVDVPVMGNRLRDVRSGFSLPEGVTLGNFGTDIARDAGGSDLAAHTDSRLDPGISCKDLAWLRRLTDLPLIVKGVMRADDAAMIAEAGAAAIVVSNHGGRQLDGAQASVTALGPIVDRVASECEVYIDGGVRRGVDVIRALALGARAVWIGRPSLWGLAVAGSEGVCQVVDILRRETERALALCGVPTVHGVGRELLAW